MYTTVTKVRQAGGYVGNSNISDSYISGLIRRGDNFIDSVISNVYTLPLPKYYEQAIVFTGTGAGSANMTITIDGSNYVVAVTNGMTASEAADAFRTAASVSSNTSFVTDGLGSGATVTIHNYSQESDSDEVTITSTDPQTVQGITATGGTVTEVSIPTLEWLSTQHAVAQLHIDDYGAESQDTDKDGFKRMAKVEEVLDGIKNKDESLFDFAKNILPVGTTQQLRYAPTSTTEDEYGTTMKAKFTINKKY